MLVSASSKVLAADLMSGRLRLLSQVGGSFLTVTSGDTDAHTMSKQMKNRAAMIERHYEKLKSILDADRLAQGTRRFTLPRESLTS